MTEDKLQSLCFQWHWNTYPNQRRLLFAVPNGGWRNPREAQKLKSTGTVAGVADMLFIFKGKTYCIELKTETGTQQKSQKEWQKIITPHCEGYFIVRSLEQFKSLIIKITES